MEPKTAIAEFAELKDGHNAFAVNIFRKFEADEIESALFSLLGGVSVKAFEAALAFAIYIMKYERSLFGKQEIDLVQKLKQGQIFQELFEGVIGQANYCKLLTMLLNLNNLPINKSDEDIDAYFDSILRSQPLLLKYLINYLIQSNGEFPSDYYSRITLADTLLEFYAKYDCIGSWLVEPFVKVELYQELLPLCPEVYTQDLAEKIKFFAHFVGDGDSELEVDPGLEEPVSPLDSLLAGYYDYCLEKGEKGESQDFERYLQYR